MNKAQRDELRHSAPMWAQGHAWKRANDLCKALDGLDIAEEAMDWLRTDMDGMGARHL